MTRSRAVPKRGLRYSERQKHELLTSFNDAFHHGHSAQEVSHALGVPLSTLRRWRLELGEAAAAKTKAMAMSRVQQSIDRLSRSAEFADASVRRAVFDFYAWLRWPDHLYSHQINVMHLQVAYWRTRGDVENLADIDPEDLQSFDLFGLARVLNGTADYPAFFEEESFSELSNQSAESIAADIAHYFIDGSVTETRTLSKALDLLNHGAFNSRPIGYADSSFRKFWRSMAPVMPFRYIERFHSDMEWNFHAHRGDFAEEIDQLVSMRDEISDFVRMALCAQDRFIERLDRRAVARINFPAFPPELVPLEFPSQDWSAQIHRSL